MSKTRTFCPPPSKSLLRRRDCLSGTSGEKAFQTGTTWRAPPSRNIAIHTPCRASRSWVSPTKPCNGLGLSSYTPPELMLDGMAQPARADERDGSLVPGARHCSVHARKCVLQLRQQLQSRRFRSSFGSHHRARTWATRYPGTRARLLMSVAWLDHHLVTRDSHCLQSSPTFAF